MIIRVPEAKICTDLLVARCSSFLKIRQLKKDNPFENSSMNQYHLVCMSQLRSRVFGSGQIAELVLMVHTS